MILALDTAHEFGSLALVDAAGVREEMPLHGPDGFAHSIFGAIDTLLQRHGMALREVDGYAVAAGPGSFTGLRVGLTVAKGLGEALGKPVFAISNLAALATFGVTPLRAPFYDARRGEVYAALPSGEEVVRPFAEFLAALPADTELISFDFGVYPVAGWRSTLANRSLAGAVGRLAWLRYAAGERPDPMLADANYVRRSDAELHWREA